MKKNLWKIAVPVVLAAVLAFAFWYGGDAAGSRGWTVPDSAAAGSPSVSGSAETLTPELPPSPPAAAEPPEQTAAQSASPAPTGSEPSPEAAPTPAAPSAGTPDASAAPAPPPAASTPAEPDRTPAPSPDTAAEDGWTCTISISCASILDNLELCDPAKVDLVPADGWILKPVTVPFYEGESVFNVLQRTCKQQKIHLEYTMTPIYNTAYIEGIANLYQFDVGETSGWKYSVNGTFPGVGCSGYPLQNGDEIRWVYACDLNEWES